MASSFSFDVLARYDNPCWGTLSGLAAHPTDPSRIYAVTDGDSPPPRIIELDVGARPAKLVRLIALTNWDRNRPLDLEGVATTPDGGFWVVSERIPEKKGQAFFPDIILKVGATGAVEGPPVELPPEIVSRMDEKGLEGITWCERGGEPCLFVAFQVPLKTDHRDGHARIGCYNLRSHAWTFWHYRLSKSEAAENKLNGLSEIAHLGGDRFAVIERDGKDLPNAFKKIAWFDLDPRDGAPHDAVPPVLTEHVAKDLGKALDDAGRDVEQEIEGLTVAADGQVYALTDNDNDRDTVLMRLGHVSEVFPV